MSISTEDSSTIINILKRLELFKGLNEADHAEIVKRITLEYYPKDHTLFNEGDNGDAFYIVKRGMVRIYHVGGPQDADKETAMLGDGNFFGEMALMSDKPRNATAQVVEESEIFKLNKEDFIKLVSTDPNMASRISSEFLKRLKANNREQ